MWAIVASPRDGRGSGEMVVETFATYVAAADALRSYTMRFVMWSFYVAKAEAL